MTEKLQKQIEELKQTEKAHNNELLEICGLLARKVEELYEILYNIDPEKSTVLSVSERRLLEKWKKVGVKKRV